MSEDYGRANLCERSDLYISQVALQGWEDTLTVLHHCESLSPHAEQLHIVSRCIDSLAFLACTELLDPVERGNRPEGRSVDGRFWNNFRVSTRDLSSSCHDWWMPDLIQLPHHLFFRSIVAIRRQGMQEKYVGQVLVKFADRWIFGTEVDTAIPHISKGDSRPIVPEFRAKPNQRLLVESVVKLLPMESFVVPTSFLFALLRCTLACSCSDDCRMQLETWIALQLEQANLNDLLLPSKAERDSSYVLTSEVEAMERIIKLFVSRHRGFSEPLSISGAMCGDPVPEFTHSFHAISTVGKLWDEYLAEIAYDLSLTPLRFADLVEKIPSYARLTHDRMYKAIHTYLEGHPKASQEERLIVCRALNCQKLTLDVCTHAVQNELMPLRMIVQAMFMQQLQTRTALNSHSRSAGQSQQLDMLPQLQTLAAPIAHQHIHRRCTSYQSHDSFESTESFRDRLFDEDRMPLGYIVKQDSAYHEAASLKADYQATETRLQILEAELSRMRKLLAETTADESSNQNQGSSLSSTTKVQAYMAGREERQPSRGATGSKRHMVNPLPTVPEGRSSRAASSGCMNQLKKVNRTSGLLARALQKLGFQNFGFSQKGRSASGGGDSKPSTTTFPVEERECGTAPVAVPWWPVKDTGRSIGGYQLENGTSRTDRISAPSTGVRYHHSRHISIG
ncbi:hypothetical protein BDL97_13G098800 [Sphagnum fallax]|nr:hypothetical protein BDL97_13G098800 [Sphagnum fallax]